MPLSGNMQRAAEWRHIDEERHSIDLHVLSVLKGQPKPHKQYLELFRAEIADCGTAPETAWSYLLMLRCVEDLVSKEAELAIIAFAALGELVSLPKVRDPEYSGNTLQEDNLAAALRQPGLIKRVDALSADAIGRVCVALADNPPPELTNGVRRLAKLLMPAAEHVVRFATKTEPRPQFMLLRLCAALHLVEAQAIVAASPAGKSEASGTALAGDAYLRRLVRLAATLDRHVACAIGQISDRALQGLLAQCAAGEFRGKIPEAVRAPALGAAGNGALIALRNVVQMRKARQPGGGSPVVPSDVADDILAIFGAIASRKNSEGSAMDCVYMAALSEGRALLMDVAPAATTEAAVAAAAELAAGAARAAAFDASLPHGSATADLGTHSSSLTTQACTLMAYMAALDAVCSGVTAQQMQSHGQLEPIWKATAAVLKLCTKWIINDHAKLQTQAIPYGGAGLQHQQQRFRRTVIHDDVTEAIAKGVQLMARSVQQLLPADDSKAAAAAVPAVFGVALSTLCAVCSGPVSAFATPGTRNGSVRSMQLMRGFLQAAYAASAVVRATIHMGRQQCVPTDALEGTLQAAMALVAMGTASKGAKAVAVPPGWLEINVEMGSARLLADFIVQFASDRPAIIDAAAVDVVKLLKRSLIAMSKISRPYYDDPDTLRDFISSGLMDHVQQGGKALEHCIQINYALADVASVSTAACMAISGAPHPWIELRKEIHDRVNAADFPLFKEALKGVSNAIFKHNAPSHCAHAHNCAMPAAQQQQQTAGSAAAKEAGPRPASGDAASSAQKAAEDAASAAADRIAQMLMDEEEAEAASKQRKTARKRGKGKKKGEASAVAVAAAPITEQPQQPAAAAMTVGARPVPGGSTSRTDAQTAAAVQSNDRDSDNGSHFGQNSGWQPPTSSDADAAADNDWQICPLTKVVMMDPVLAKDGRTYERSAIAVWLEEHGTVSPVTGEAMSSRDLIPNHSLRSVLDALRSK